jgi:hypothetical protein
VDNKKPPCIEWDAHKGGPLAGIKGGLAEGARRAFVEGKMNPQLIIVVMPVRLLSAFLTRADHR